MRPVVVAFVLGAIAGGAAAEPTVPSRARTLAEQGRKAHAAGEYHKAADAFERAYALSPSSGLLFNLAQAYRLAGDCENALIMYRRFLDAGPTVEMATVAGVHLRAMERCVHPAGSSIAIVGVSTSPRIELATAVTAKKSSGASTAPGATSVTSIRTVSHHRLETALAISGVAALGVSLVYGLDAMSANDDVEAMYARGAKWSEIQPIDERGHHDTRVATVFAIGGVAAIGTAVGLYLYDRHEEKQAERAMISIGRTSTGQGGRVSLSWRF